MLSIKVLCQTVAASASATAIILGLSGSAKVAAQAIADNMAPSLHLPALTGSYQVGTTSYDFVYPSRDDIYAPEPTDKRELGLFTGHLNLKRVGILGHSLGGATAASAMLQDHRFKAGVDMDGQLYGNVVQQGLDQPFMLLNSEIGGTLNPTLEPFYEHLKNDAYNLTIKGAGHLNFTDESLLFQQLEAYSPALAAQLNNDNFIGSIDANRGAQIIDDYTLAFFDKYLKNQNLPLLKGADPNYPEVQFSSRHGRHSNFSPRAELCSRVYDFCRDKSLVKEDVALRH